MFVAKTYTKQKRKMAERTNRYYHLDLINDHCDGKYDMPVIRRQDVTPTEILLPFNLARTCKRKDVGVHFFLDDYQFERVWRRPGKYIEMLAQFPFVLSPGFSLYTDMPLAMKMWNNWRRQFVAEYWQRNGLTVVPTVMWAEERTFQFCFDGIEPGGTIAVSTQGPAMSKRGREFWKKGMREAMRRLNPTTILHYGKPLDFDFGDTNVVYFDNIILKQIRP